MQDELLNLPPGTYRPKEPYARLRRRLREEVPTLFGNVRHDTGRNRPAGIASGRDSSPMERDRRSRISQPELERDGTLFGIGAPGSPAGRRHPSFHLMRKDLSGGCSFAAGERGLGERAPTF